jgi:hypothetical protein
VGAELKVSVEGLLIFGEAKLDTHGRSYSHFQRTVLQKVVSELSANILIAATRCIRIPRL